MAFVTNMYFVEEELFVPPPTHERLLPKRKVGVLTK